MMTQPIPYTAVLTCHPETSSRWVRGIEARVGWTERGALALTYSLEGDIARLRIPPPQPTRRAEGLWQHTCFEVFLVVKGQQSYWEFNFSPSGEWAAYAFKNYRDGGLIEGDGLDPEITVRNVANGFELNAIVRLDRLHAINSHTPMAVGLSAVVEETAGTHSYWALKHTQGKPDFHHPDSFALELALPDKSA